VFDWLFEGQITVYVLLAFMLVGLLFIFWRRRLKLSLCAMLGVVMLIGLYALLDRLIETDREQIERKIGEMAEGLRSDNADAVFQHFSASFRSPLGKDKASLRVDAANHINHVTEVIIWNFRWEAKPELGKEYDDLRFSFKVRGVGVDDFPFDCQPVFEHNATKGWQLKRLKIYKFGTTEEMAALF